ncbi:MAG: hypothetical protein WC095_01720 [Candidatus Paceibacterota bacterium]
MHEFALVLDKAGFDADLVQRVVNSRGNKQAKAMYAALMGGAQIDDRFKLVNTFEIVVPEGYDHSKRLDSFGKEHRKAFYYYNDAITDKNYAKATTKLEAGRKLKVKVFQIKETVTSEDCMAKLRSEKAILVGAQGASLVWEQKKEELPVNRSSVSFDEKDALWKDAHGYRRVPRVSRRSDGDFRFDLGFFGLGWRDVDCLLCFCDE